MGILLPVLKPYASDVVSHTADVEVSDRKHVTISPLSTLTLPLVKLIVTFLGRPKWEHQDHDIPGDVAAKLALSDEFCATQFEQLLSTIRAEEEEQWPSEEMADEQL